MLLEDLHVTVLGLSRGPTHSAVSTPIFFVFSKILTYRTDIGNTSISLHRKSCHNRKRKPLLQLLQLNSSIRPGLSEKDFRALFVQCNCGLVMTKDAFHVHYCTVETEVIEITDSDSSE
jgi:hypothetical protein